MIYLELVIGGSQLQMVYERVEHVFRRDHITADQQFGFAHRWSPLIRVAASADGRVHRLAVKSGKTKTKRTNRRRY